MTDEIGTARHFEDRVRERFGDASRRAKPEEYDNPSLGLVPSGLGRLSRRVSEFVQSSGVPNPGHVVMAEVPGHATTPWSEARPGVPDSKLIAPIRDGVLTTAYDIPADRATPRHLGKGVDLRGDEDAQAAFNLRRKHEPHPYPESLPVQQRVAAPDADSLLGGISPTSLERITGVGRQLAASTDAEWMRVANAPDEKSGEGLYLHMKGGEVRGMHSSAKRLPGVPDISDQLARRLRIRSSGAERPERRTDPRA